MSPHAVLSTQIHPTAELKKYWVTRNAFLPEDKPLQMLPDAYYGAWELIVHHLPILIKTGGIRGAIDSLPVLSTDRLRSEPEWRRAYSVLAFLTHAYVWGGQKPKEILPPQISVPFLRVSRYLDLPPVLTYAAANLWNFSCGGNDFTRLEDLQTLQSFTGTRSESWFLLISVAMEARAGSIIPPMMEALEAVKTRNYPVISKALGQLRLCIDGVGELLERMYERNDPQEFYHHIRPFLAGSKNMEAAGLPRGVFYDEGNGKGEWMQLRGGSNGQSSLIQFFDILLGVEHVPTSNNTPKEGQRSYHEEVRDYMPGPHRKFLRHVARMGSIRELAMLEPTTHEQQELRQAFTAATDALAVFRNKHIQIVTRYIILPSRQAAAAAAVSSTTASTPTSASSTSVGAGAVSSRQNLASSSARKGGEDLTGTGGTTLVPFLKQTRDETSAAGVLQARIQA